MHSVKKVLLVVQIRLLPCLLLQKEKTQDEIIEVRHLLVNLATMNLRRKLDHLKEKGYENLNDFHETSLNELLLKINEEHSNDIEKHHGIRQVTDFQFQTTFKLNLFNLMMMLAVLVVPFVTHLFVDQRNKATIRNCLIVCQCGSLFFMA